MMQYFVICGILVENNCFAFCNAFKKTELSPAREENTLHTHHNPLSLQNKSCWDGFISISNWRLFTRLICLMRLLMPLRPTRPKPMMPTRLMRPKPLRPTKPARPICTITPFMPLRLMRPKPLRPRRLMRPKPMSPISPVRLLWLISPARLRPTRLIWPTRPLMPLRPMRLMRPRLMMPMRPMGPWFDKANESMRLIWPNEAVAANASNGADASNAAWVDMADVNENNNGKFDFC